ncbi:MAG: type II secretion system F family protein [Acidobacteriaceae bacterium]|nr:type II secretion system F family protein [Acidobacteriaceae bacterium]
MLVAILVFVSVFVVVALMVLASGAGASERIKRNVARLDAVLIVGKSSLEDEIIDLRKQEMLSAIPALNRLLLKVDVAPRLRRLLYQAQVKWTPGKLLLMVLTTWALAGYCVHLRTGSVIPSLLLGAVSATWPLIYVFFKRGRRFKKFEEGLPAALDMMVNGLRGGHSLVSCLGLVARESPNPIGQEFRVCYDEQNYGLELRTAMENLATRIPLQDLRIIMTAILIQKETGGNLAEVLEKCGHVIRDRFRLKREILTRTAQGRLTGMILSLLPVVLGVLLYFVNPDGISLLWKQPLGLKMLYGASGMTVIGSLIIQKIVRIRV